MLSSQTPKQITDRLVQSFSSSFAVEKALKWEGSDGIGLDLGIVFSFVEFPREFEAVEAINIICG